MAKAKVKKTSLQKLMRGNAPKMPRSKINGTNRRINPASKVG